MKIRISQAILAGTVFALGSFATVRSNAESEECDELPQARQAMCWMVLSCTAIEESSQRQECFRAAYEGFREATGRQGSAVALEPTALHPPAAVEAAPPPPKQSVAVQAAAPKAATVPDKAAAEPAIAPSTVASSAAPDVASAAEPVSSEYEVETTTTKAVTIADEFNATVTYQRTLLLDRQIFVVDNAFVFEGDEAGVSRLEVGDLVAIERTSRLYKDRFSVTGPSKRPVEAKRIRCENNDQSADTVEKCELRKR